MKLSLYIVMRPTVTNLMKKVYVRSLFPVIFHKNLHMRNTIFSTAASVNVSSVYLHKHQDMEVNDFSRKMGNYH